IIHLLYPQFLPSRAAHAYARFMIRRALRRADRIVTVSYNTRRDLEDYFNVPAARIEVIYNGVSARFNPAVPAEERLRVAAKLGISSPYLLFLGGEKPHKNVQNVVRAFGKARRENALPQALAIAAGIVLLATDANARAEYSALGRKRALDFSWDRTARKTLEVYAAALAGKRESGIGNR